jgi:hypothetical protein
LYFNTIKAINDKTTVHKLSMKNESLGQREDSSLLNIVKEVLARENSRQKK